MNRDESEPSRHAQFAVPPEVNHIEADFVLIAYMCSHAQSEADIRLHGGRKEPRCLGAKT